MIVESEREVMRRILNTGISNSFCGTRELLCVLSGCINPSLALSKSFLGLKSEHIYNDIHASAK